MATQTSTGITFAVSASTPATFDSAGFAALSYDLVGEITTIPQSGASFTPVNHEPLATGVTEKYKGFVDYGSVALDAALDTSDAGQTVMKAGADGAEKFTKHSFKLTYQDGSIEYWYGSIYTFQENPSGANSMVTVNMQIELDKPKVYA